MKGGDLVKQTVSVCVLLQINFVRVSALMLILPELALQRELLNVLTYTEKCGSSVDTAYINLLSSAGAQAHLMSLLAVHGGVEQAPEALQQGLQHSSATRLLLVQSYQLATETWPRVECPILQGYRQSCVWLGSLQGSGHLLVVPMQWTWLGWRSPSLSCPCEVVLCAHS